MKRRITFGWKLLFIISLTLSLLLGQLSFTNAGTPEPSQLVRQGVAEYQNQNYRAAIAIWERALATYRQEDAHNAAIVLENLARASQQIGQTERAIAFWSQVSDHYQQLGNRRQLGRSFTERAQGYSRIGQHRQAIALLCNNVSNFEVSSASQDPSNNKETAERQTAPPNLEIPNCQPGSALAIARERLDRLGEVAALGSLTEAYHLRGDYQIAASYAKNSLAIAQKLNNTQLTLSALNSLGKIYSSLAQVSYRRAESAETRGEIYGSNSLMAVETRSARDSDRQALDYFGRSLELATAQQNSLARVRSINNLLPIYYRLQQYDRAESQKQLALSLISNLPPQASTVYATIDLAKLLQSERVTFNSCLASENLPQARELLQSAVTLATQLENKRAESFALGELGHIYECERNYPQALKLTQRARLAAERDKDSLYLWEWQTGRILQAQGKREPSIVAYETAVATLESIRDDLLTANRDIQFDFRDTVEPIYRELIDQRLGTENNTIVVNADGTEKAKNVSSILDTVDSLRLAELQNYFGNDCAIAEVANVGTVDLLAPDSQTVYFSSIILEDRTAIVAKFSGKTKIVWQDRSKDDISEEINEFRRGLENYYNRFDPQQGQKIYSWLIQPFAEDLQQEEIKTLVFIQDGLLRSIPMAALHDGKQFLVEQYAIATTPSLNLTNRNRLENERLKALALGLTEESQVDGRIFNPLPNVEREIQVVTNIFVESTGLLNAEFTRDRLRQELEQTSYPIVHIATHGQFSSEPEDTFLVIGDGQKLTITELDRLIRTTATDNEPVDLIALTACQTAVGDERATLGLAGVAIQAGASSALASLWSISDEITPQVVRNFYANFKEAETTKAEALRAAQQDLIAQEVHPAYWSPFIIIGDWL